MSDRQSLMNRKAAPGYDTTQRRHQQAVVQVLVADPVGVVPPLTLEEAKAKAVQDEAAVKFHLTAMLARVLPIAKVISASIDVEGRSYEVEIYPSEESEPSALGVLKPESPELDDASLGEL